MTTRKLNELPGILPGQPASDGGVQKVDCGNVATIKNCILPFDLGDPLTLEYSQDFILPSLVKIPAEVTTRLINPPITYPVMLAPTFSADCLIDLELTSSGYISITNNFNDPGTPTRASWMIQANIGGVYKSGGVSTETPNNFGFGTTLFITEDGTTGTQQFALLNDGDWINAKIRIVSDPPNTDGSIAFNCELTRLSSAFLPKIISNN